MSAGAALAGFLLPSEKGGPSFFFNFYAALQSIKASMQSLPQFAKGRGCQIGSLIATQYKSLSPVRTPPQEVIITNIVASPWFRGTRQGSLYNRTDEKWHGSHANERIPACSCGGSTAAIVYVTANWFSHATPKAPIFSHGAWLRSICNDVVVMVLSCFLFLARVHNLVE